MATRSLICKELPNGRFKTIFCRFDGYLEYNGCILNNSYTTEEKVDKLLALGDLACLDVFTDKDETQPHNMSKRQHGVCVAYGRDENEPNCEAKELTFKQLMDRAVISWAEYVYMFRKDKVWVYTQEIGGVNGRFTRKEIYDLFSNLSEAVKSDEEVNMDPEISKMLDELNNNMDDELKVLQEQCKHNADSNRANLNDRIQLLKLLQVYLISKDESFNKDQLKALTSTKNVLSKIADIKLDQTDIMKSNQYTLAVEKFFELYKKADEMC